MSTLEVEDPNANLEGPNGEKFMQRNGRIELPDGYERVAAQATAPRTLFHTYKRRFAGADIAELEARYKEWERERLHNVSV